MIRVVLADDEQKICQLIARLINWDDLGMELVGTAGDGVATLELIEKEQPDLVVTDIRMPGYDGIELIERARKLRPDLEFVIISGYSQFSYAQAAIRYGVSDYILKPVNRELLNATLKKVSEKILLRNAQREGREKEQKQRSEDIATLRFALLQILWEEPAPEAETGERAPKARETAFISEINDKYRYGFREGEYRCIMFSLRIKEVSRVTSDYARRLTEMVSPGMLSLFDQYMKPCCLESELFTQDGLFTMIVNYDHAEDEKILRVAGFMFAQLREKAKAVPDISVYMAAGAAKDSLFSLQGTLSGTEELFTQRFLTPSMHTITSCTGDVVYDQDALFKPLSDDINRAMEARDERLVKEALRHFHDGAMRMQLSGKQLLHCVKGAYHIYVLTGMFHKGYHPGDREKLEEKFARCVRLCADTPVLFAFLEMTCLAHMEKSVRALDAERMKPMQQAMLFMQEHYMEDIGLEDVSSAAGFSVSYFSTVFRKETGRTCLEYLTGIRMDEARRLLRENKMSIEMVGKAVGLSDYKRFARTFKKETGVSPGEYRSLYAH